MRLSEKIHPLAAADYVFCFFNAMAFAAAPYYLDSGDCSITLELILTVIAYFALFILIAYISRMALARHDWNISFNQSKLMIELDKIFSHKHSILISVGVMLAFWIIPIVFLYPGTFINDTWGQLQSFSAYIGGYNVLSDHHPLFSTLLMGALIVPISQLTGKWKRVIFVYVLLQALITAWAFANAVNYAYKKLNLGIKISASILTAYCILPFFPAAVQTVSKDALHSWAFVFFTIYYIEMIRTKGDAIKDKKFLVKFILVIIYCCLTKKVAFYVIALSLLAVLIVQKKNREYVLIPIISAVFLMNIVMPVARICFEASPGGKQEMFSLPFQMTARYVKEYGEDVSEEEYEILDRVIGMDGLADRYNPTHADPVKGYSQRAADRDYIKYIKVWLSQGLRHPDAYIKALNSMLAGWFSWYEYAPLMNCDWRSQHDIYTIPAWVPERGFSEVTANAYQKFYDNLYSIPIVGTFLSYGFYASLLPAFAVCTVLRKWKNKEVKYWLALLPMLFALILGCWLAPVSYQIEGRRYLYPVVYTLPLVLAWCGFIYKSNSEFGSIQTTDI